MTTVAEVISKAADEIERLGLACGEYISPSGKICAMEALYRAATGKVDAVSYSHALTLGEITGDQSNLYINATRTVAAEVAIAAEVGGVSVWSDSWYGDSAHVITKLREIAARQDYPLDET
jgi:hypothetical protein